MEERGNSLTESSNDDDSSSPTQLTPYLLFYSDVLKELNEKKDAVDIAKEAKERWSKMTPRSLQYYIEASSSGLKPNRDIKVEPETSKTKARKKKSRPRKFQAKTENPNAQKRRRTVKKSESKNILRSSLSIAKRPINDWEKMINWVTSSRILRYRGKYAKSKSCRRGKSSNQKRKIKRKASKCKNCKCKTVKGYCSCHKKKKSKSSSDLPCSSHDSEKRNLKLKAEN